VSELVERTLAELMSGCPATVQDAVSRAAAFFEQAAGHPQPSDPEVAGAAASPDELAALRDALICVVMTSPAPEIVASGLFALGKCADRSLIQFFVQWLVAHHRENAFATQQALIGLNNFDEPTLSLEGYLSATDPDLTLRQAEHYLRSIGAI
jgi:hypothetical protein